MGLGRTRRDRYDVRMPDELEYWRSLLTGAVLRRGTLQHPEVLWLSRMVDARILAEQRRLANVAGSPEGAETPPSVSGTGR
jgi:hypothetical protein